MFYLVFINNQKNKLSSVTNWAKLLGVQFHVLWLQLFLFLGEHIVGDTLGNWHYHLHGVGGRFDGVFQRAARPCEQSKHTTIKYKGAFKCAFEISVLDTQLKIAL